MERERTKRKIKKTIIPVWTGFLLILVLCKTNGLSAQSDSASNQQLIAKTRLLLIDSLKLKPARNFYTETIHDDSLFTYVYVSSSNSISALTPGHFYYYGTNTSKGRKIADSISRLPGCDVMLYQTAGTSASLIHPELLRYDPLSIAFIMMHEAMHTHLVHAGYRIPYDFEEAIGDVAGNHFLKNYTDPSLKKDVRRFVKCNRKVYRNVNRCLKGRRSKSKTEQRIYDITEKYGTSFQKQRYRYPVNNAYLLRFRDYTTHYFRLNRKFTRKRNIHEALHACFSKYRGR